MSHSTRKLSLLLFAKRVKYPPIYRSDLPALWAGYSVRKSLLLKSGRASCQHAYVAPTEGTDARSQDARVSAKGPKARRFAPPTQPQRGCKMEPGVAKSTPGPLLGDQPNPPKCREHGFLWGTGAISSVTLSQAGPGPSGKDELGLTTKDTNHVTLHSKARTPSSRRHPYMWRLFPSCGRPPRRTHN